MNYSHEAVVSRMVLLGALRAAEHDQAILAMLSTQVDYDQDYKDRWEDLQEALLEHWKDAVREINLAWNAITEEVEERIRAEDVWDYPYSEYDSA